eukprot:1803269-Prorocentrum_lima.AAC.1
MERCNFLMPLLTGCEGGRAEEAGACPLSCTHAQHARAGREGVGGGAAARRGAAVVSGQVRDRARVRRWPYRSGVRPCTWRRWQGT